jgi:ABC-2 type transport system permease protein
MKSRTSSFNLTVIQKDLTRFAPGWAAYLIVLLLTLMAMVEDGDVYYRLRNMNDAVILTGWANLIYGAVVAQLLFGDLYNSRLCNALHAMPVTRDSWFMNHTVSALAFSLLPNALVALLAIPVLNLGVGTHTIFWWLLASQLQYLFFFGTAALCVMITGNRIGQIAAYLVIQFAGLLTAWMASSLYEPLLYGILFDMDAFYPYCPVAQITRNDELFIIDATVLRNEFGDWMGHDVHSVTLGAGWGYLALVAGLGIAALAGALALYRKRKLECAGDFVAFPVLEPVALVLATVFAGGFFHMLNEMFGLNISYAMLVAGAVVGFFGCRMLLMRTTRVFQKKAFLGCGAIMGVVALTLLLTWLDPAGVTRYVPEADEVESVTVSRSTNLDYRDDFPFEATEIADIEALLEVHADCLDGSAYEVSELHPDSYHTLDLRLEYKLKNGKIVNRFYSVYPLSEAGQVLKGYFTRPECVLGFSAEQAAQMADYIYSFYTNGSDKYHEDLDELDLEGLLEAIVADCEAGNMAQFTGYHYPNGVTIQEAKNYDDVIAHIEIGWDHEKLETALQGKTTAYGIISYSSIRVFRSCENTLRWLEKHDLLSEEQFNELGGVTASFTTG